MFSLVLMACGGGGDDSAPDSVSDFDERDDTFSIEPSEAVDTENDNTKFFPSDSSDASPHNNQPPTILGASSYSALFCTEGSLSISFLDPENDHLNIALSRFKWYVF